MSSRSTKRRSRPCRYCRRWFRPSPRVGQRQYACDAPACQAHRQRENEATWRAAHPGYFRRRRRQRTSPPSEETAARSRRGRRNAGPVAQQVVSLELVSSEALRAGLASAERRKLVAPELVVVLGLRAGLTSRDGNKEIDLGPRACYQRGRRLLKEVMPR
jgi:hypothetical protein